jgi:hypothetical protein
MVKSLGYATKQPTGLAKAAITNNGVQTRCLRTFERLRASLFFFLQNSINSQLSRRRCVHLSKASILFDGQGRKAACRREPDLVDNCYKRAENRMHYSTDTHTYRRCVTYSLVKHLQHESKICLECLSNETCEITQLHEVFHRDSA